MNEKIEQYCEDHSGPYDAVLNNIERRTHLKVYKGHMVSGKLQGKLLQFISFLVKPKHVLEIGTFTAYATICLAHGLQENGTITTIEKNDELEKTIRENLKLAKIDKLTNLFIEDANLIIPTLKQKFDLIFMDAAKGDYSKQFDLLLDLLAPEGVIMVDNVLWRGEVLKEKKNKIAMTLDFFNKKIKEDVRVEKMILPLRDGVLIARKI